MSAYGIEYLDDAMRNLGEMTDYAVNACGMDLEDFWKLFLTTGYAEKFGEGVPRVVERSLRRKCFEKREKRTNCRNRR